MCRTAFLAVLWTIWRERNSRCFANLACHGETLPDRLKMIIALWVSIHPIFRGISMDLIVHILVEGGGFPITGRLTFVGCFCLWTFKKRPFGEAGSHVDPVWVAFVFSPVTVSLLLLLLLFSSGCWLVSLIILYCLASLMNINIKNNDDGDENANLKHRFRK